MISANDLIALYVGFELQSLALYVLAAFQRVYDLGRKDERNLGVVIMDEAFSKLSGDQVKFGARVTIVDEETDEEKTYRIVGAHEADMKAGSISLSSPLAKALIGKKVGDSVEVPAPGGARVYEIAAVRFA